MSVAGSLFLTGLGGFAHKYDHTQVYQPHPNLHYPIRQYGSHVIKAEILETSELISELILNFLPEFFTNHPFIYPFKGLLELFRNRSVYSHISVGIVTTYLFSFAIVLFVYWFSIAPVYFSLMAVFGPLGFIIAGLQCVLQANLLTMLFMRTSFMFNGLVPLCLKFYKGDSKKTLLSFHDAIKYYVPVRSAYFWLIHLPFKGFKYLLGLLILVLLLGISSIPVLGPFLFHLSTSSVLTRIYSSKFLRMNGTSTKERSTLFYKHFGFYTSFGMVAGLLETVPILSGFCLCSNVIGATLWHIDREPMAPVEATVPLEAQVI